EFKQLSGFGEALDALDYNPLPPLLIVQPASEFDNPASLEQLLNELAEHGQVDLAQL
ncbi:MAG: cell division protein FtsX, partial [Burkholderiales bacterium]|nr:cell division protein FtsX [Burkholderiales bacterium]